MRHDTYVDEEDEGWRAYCNECPWHSRAFRPDEYEAESNPLQSAYDTAAVTARLHSEAYAGRA